MSLNLQAKQKRVDAVYSNHVKDDTYFFEHDMLGCKKIIIFLNI